MNELVSVIVTSYNHAEYLNQRIDSLLNQTYKPIEIIVIDDCSTDGSLEVLKQYKDYQQMNLIALERNGGYANACNLGISLCRGDYIMFAECDDFNEPDHIKTLMTVLGQRNDVGVAYCRSHIVDNLGQITGDDFRCREDSFKELCRQDAFISKERMLRFLLTSCVIPNMSAALIKKDSIRNVGGLSPHYKVCADWDFWCRLAMHYHFYYVAAPLNCFRTHSTTARNIFGIAVQVPEYYRLLYGAMPKANLTVSENLRFRIYCGHLWANFITRNLSEWLACFSSVKREIRQYEKYSVFFLFAGMLMKGSLIALKLMKGEYKS